MSERKPQRDADANALESIRQRREDLADAVPRIGVFLLDCSDPDALRATLGRFPEAADAWIDEVLIVQDTAASRALRALQGGLPGRALSVHIHRTPRAAGFGALRKAAFEYSLLRGLDLVVTMHGDGRHPPEALPELLQPLFLDRRRLVVGSRFARAPRDPAAPRAGLGHAATTALRNRVLGLRLRDYDSSYRAWSTWALRRIPFQLDANDRAFDMQNVIQCRALGLPIVEVPVRDAWREEDGGGPELPAAVRACGTAVDYRLHQLHATRRGRYLVDEGVHYTLKMSRTGSHMQIVSAIRPGSRVLDLGCSQGLLARPLREKNARVTGVDEGPGRDLAEELAEYHRRDLEQPLDLPLGRVFDYVVVSDVIEHLRNRTQLLRGARRYLKEDGRLLISTGNIALWFYRLSLLVGRFEYGPRGVLDETHVHLFTRETFRREVAKAGYHVLRESVTALPFEVVFESTGRSRLIRALGRAYHALAQLWPAMFAYQFLLEAEITTLDEESTSPG